MNLQFAPYFMGIKINVHLILEYLAFFLAFRYYVSLRKKQEDTISHQNRLSIILGAVVGAFIGSRLMGFLENPIGDFSTDMLLQLFHAKSIMGGLFGGLLGVKWTKKIIHEKKIFRRFIYLPYYSRHHHRKNRLLFKWY